MSGRLAGLLATAAIRHSKSPVDEFRQAQESRSNVHSARISVACSGNAESTKKNIETLHFIKETHRRSLTGLLTKRAGHQTRRSIGAPNIKCDGHSAHRSLSAPIIKRVYLRAERML